MPKIALETIIELNQKPAFFESLQHVYGGYARAGKILKVPPSLLSRMAEPMRKFGKAPRISDANVLKLQKAIGRMSPSDYRTASYGIDALGRMTPGQLEFSRRYTRKSGAAGNRARAYFKKAIKQYHDGETERVRMAAITTRGGKEQIYNSPRIKKVAKKGRGKRAIRRSRRRRNRR